MNIYHTYVKANADKSDAELCELILQENEALKHLKKNFIMRRLNHERRLIAGELGITLVANEKMKCLWEYDDKTKKYNFNFDGSNVSYPEEVVSFICMNYTQPAGLTASVVADKAKKMFDQVVTEYMVTKIIQLFDMTKTSPPFAPHEVIAMDSDKLMETLIARKRQKIEAAITEDSESMALKKALTEEVAYNKKLNDFFEQTQRLIGKSIVDQNFALDRAEHLATKYVNQGPKDTSSLLVTMSPFNGQGMSFVSEKSRPSVNRNFYYDNQYYSAPDKNKSMHVLFCDWHIGKKTGSFDKTVAKTRVKRFVDEIVFQVRAQNVGDVHIHIEGDMVDGPSGTMHPEQWLHQDIHLEDQIQEASTLIADAILAIHTRTNDRVASITAIGGNHGRFAPDRASEPSRMADTLTYNMVKLKLGATDRKSLAENMEITSREDMYVKAYKGLCVIGHHGDKLQKDAVSTIWELRENNPYVRSSIDPSRRTCWIWLHGHLHCNVFEEVQTNIYSIRGGSLAGADEYSLRIGKGARASQMAFIHDLRQDSVSPIWIPLD